MQHLITGLSPYLAGAIVEASKDQASVGHAGADGGRYDSENQDASFSARSSVMRTHADAEQLLSDSIARAADGLKKETRYEGDGGTTATVAAFTPDDKVLTIAQAGDSPVFVVFQNKETGAVKIIDLTADHSAPGEQARIEAAGGEVIEGRANGILAVSRSITLGNTDYGPGVISDPQFTKVGLSEYPEFMDGKHRAFLFVGSDGMTEFSTPNEIAAGFQPERSVLDIAKAIISGAIEKALGTGKDKDWFDNLTANVTELKPDSTEALIAGVMDGHGKNGGVASTMLPARLERDSAAPAAMAAKSGLGLDFQAASTEPDPGFDPLALIFQGGFKHQVIIDAVEGNQSRKRLNIAALPEEQIRAVENTLRVLGFTPERETNVCGGRYIVLNGDQHRYFDAMTDGYRSSDYPEAGVRHDALLCDDADGRERIISQAAWTQGRDKEGNPLLRAKVTNDGCVLLASLYTAGVGYSVSRSADGALYVSVSGEGMRELEGIINIRSVSGIDNLRYSEPQSRGMSPA